MREGWILSKSNMVILSLVIWGNGFEQKMNSLKRRPPCYSSNIEVQQPVTKWGGYILLQILCYSNNLCEVLQHNFPILSMVWCANSLKKKNQVTSIGAVFTCLIFEIFKSLTNLAILFWLPGLYNSQNLSFYNF